MIHHEELWCLGIMSQLTRPVLTGLLFLYQAQTISFTDITIPFLVMNNLPRFGLRLFHFYNRNHLSQFSLLLLHRNWAQLSGLWNLGWVFEWNVESKIHTTRSNCCVNETLFLPTTWRDRVSALMNCAHILIRPITPIAALKGRGSKGAAWYLIRILYPDGIVNIMHYFWNIIPLRALFPIILLCMWYHHGTVHC